MSEIRLLRKQDIASVMRLNKAAGWNQTEQDWDRVIRIEPEGCFALEADGGIVATATAVCYGTRLAWIGMVLTDPAYRGRGFARALMDHAIAFVEARGVEWIKLDATDMGHPLYAKLGFVDESPVERWLRPAADCAAPEGIVPYAFDAALDATAIGADRALLMADLAAACPTASSGAAYAMGREGANAAYFGPCVATDARDARKLLQWFLAPRAGQNVYWDILPENGEALALAREFGFERRRQLVRMTRPGVAAPAPFHRHDDYVFAIAGFEYG